MKKHIPNALTCCNLISGCIATLLALSADYRGAFLFIVIGAVFDFFDGFSARLLHVASPIGKELDSLADDITFGFAPAAIVFAMLRQLMAPEHLPAGIDPGVVIALGYLPYVAFLIAAFSALRLAKFNLDERQTTSFIGLPTPANALFWASISVAIEQNGWLDEGPWLAFAIVPVALFVCWLLVSEVPMFALKFKSFKLHGNELRYGFILCSVILLAGLRWIGFAAVIVLYVLMSVTNNIIGTKVAQTEEDDD